MTAWFYFVAIELLLSATQFYCSASRVRFEANPANIYPVLSKTFKLRCAVVSDGVPKTTQSNTIVGRQLTNTVTTPPSTASWWSVSWTTNPVSTDSPQADVLHISSILISKVAPVTDKVQIVASVSPYDQPAVFVDDGKVTAAGDTESSDIDGEQGYLQIMWVYPLDEQSGNYTCEVFGVDSTLRPVSLRTSVNVRSKQPELSDLITYIADNEKLITQLKNQLEVLEQNYHGEIEELQSKYNSTKAQNIQTGAITCPTSNYFIVFPQPYNYTPIVYTSPSHIQMSSSSVFDVTIYNVNTTGFRVTCSNSYSATVSWLAIDN